MKRLIAVFLMCLVALPGIARDADADFRFHHIGATNIRFPTGFVRTTTGYISDGSHNSFFFAQPVWSKFLEVSGLRHLNGPTKDKNVLNLKVKLLEEDQLIPSIVYGVADVQEKLGSKIFFFAGSKSLEAFGVTLHAGLIKDPVTTDKKVFYGFEKVVFPLIIVAAESFEGDQSFGIKLRPYPGVSVEFAQRDVNTDHKDSIYKILYFQQL